MEVSREELEWSNIPENIAHISVDSAKKVLNVLSKFSYDTEPIKRIVAAVTIIFVDTDSEEDLCEGDGAGGGSLPWKNIPSSLSVLPHPGYQSSGRVIMAHQGAAPSSDTQTAGEHDQSHAAVFLRSPTAESIKQEPVPDAGYGFISVQQNSSTDQPIPSLKHIGPMKFTNQNRHAQSKNQEFSLLGVDRKAPGRFSQSTCSVCLREIRSRKDFISHAKAHKSIMGGGECCPICFKTFVRNVGLIRHSNVHSTNEYYCCPVCKINIMQLDSLKRHFHKRHPGSLAKLKQYLATSRHRNLQSNIGTGHVFSTSDPETDSSHPENKVESHANLPRSIVPMYDRKRRLSTYRQSQAQKQSNGQRIQLGTGPSEFASSPCVSEGKDMQEPGPSFSTFAHFGRNKTPLRNSASTNLQKSSTCSFCWSPMTNLEEYLDHMDSHRHLMNVPNTCPVCLHEFSDKMRVKRHASRHVQTAVYSCPLCRIQIPRVDSFRRHIRKVHPEHTEIINIEHSYKHTPVGQNEQMSGNHNRKMQPMPMTTIKKELSSPSEDAASSDEMLYTFFDPTSESVMTKFSAATSQGHPLGVYSLPSTKTSGSDSGEPSSSFSREGEPQSSCFKPSSFSREGEPQSSNFKSSSFSREGDSQSSSCKSSSFSREGELQSSSFSRDSEPLGEMAISSVQTSSEGEGTHIHRECSSPRVQWQIGEFHHAPQESTGEPPGLSTCSKEIVDTPIMSTASFHAPRGRGATSASKTDLQDIKPDFSLQGQSIPLQSGSGKKQIKNKKLTSVCFFCSATLTNSREFLEHARLHVEGNKITCPVCVTDYARKLGLMRHSVNHVPSDAHICTICGASFARRDVMLRHYRKVHRVVPDYVSPTARLPDATMSVQEQEDLPILSFDSITAPSIPPLPGDGDSDVNAASMNVVDDEDMLYSCGLCGAQYHDTQSLQEHVQNHPHDI